MLDLKFLALKRLTASLKLLWQGRSLSGGVDNTVLNSGTGGDTIASDDIAGVKYQRVKVVFGADGSATDASSTNPLPADVINALPAGDNNIGNIDVLTVITGTGATNLGKAEDAAHASADTGVAMWAVRDDGASASFVSAASDYAPLVVDEKGALWTRTRFGTIDAPTGGGVEASTLRVTIANDSTGLVSVDDNAGSLTVDVGTALPTGGNNIGDVDVLTLPNVTLAAGTNTNEVVGDVAHDSPVSGNPLLLAGEARTTNPTAVANGDVVRLSADVSGRLITQPFGPRGIVRTGYWQFSTASEVALIGSAGAGVFSDLLHLSISNSSTQTNGIPIVTIRDSIGGATRYAYAVATGGGGIVLNFPYPVPQTTADNSWTAHPNLAQATIYVMMMTIDRV